MRAFVFIFSILIFSNFSWASPFSLEEEESDKNNPYTQYGVFGEDENEAETLLFFQHGRFYGISLGTGYSGVTGNRGKIWQGGFPLIDVKIHYWFDFQFALQLGISAASHYYFSGSVSSTRKEVSVSSFGLDLKYYIDTRNLSAPVAFASPYLLLGVGNFSKTEEDASASADPTEDSVFGYSAGFGLEFPVKYRKSYFVVESRVNLVNYSDRNDTTSVTGVNDLSGLFYSVSGSFLFTW